MAYFELLTVLILTIANGLLAMSEMAIASSRLPKLRAMAQDGVRGATRALKLAEDPGRFLSTVQIGITLIGILAGAVSGASLGNRLTGILYGAGIGKSLSEVLGFGVVIGAITYVSLIIGELVPKQIALQRPERLACAVAPAMALLAKVSSPIVWLLNKSGKLVLSLLGRDKAKEDTVSDAEIHSLIAEAEQAGVIQPEERTMISGVLRLGDKTVRSIMVPRSDVISISVDATDAEVGKCMAETRHSSLVIYKGQQDNVIGVLQAKDVSTQLLRKRKFNLARTVKKAPVILDTMDAVDAVEVLRNADVHFGVVYDEYGHFEGIITNADILESIAGAFQLHSQGLEPAIVTRDDGSLLVNGWTPVETLQTTLKLQLPARRPYNTVAGLVLELFGRLPNVGETVERDGYRYEVVDLDGRRIDKVLIVEIPSARTSANNAKN